MFVFAPVCRETDIESSFMPFLFTAQLFLVFGDYGVVCHFFYVRVCLKQREMLFVSSIDYILTFFVPMVEAEVKYWLLGQTWPEINDSHAFFFSSSVTMGALQRSTITAFFLLRPQHSQPEKLSAVQKKKKNPAKEGVVYHETKENGVSTNKQSSVLLSQQEKAEVVNALRKACRSGK